MDEGDKPVKMDGASREDVRRSFPTVVAFADECRAVFGDGVKLVYAKENGCEIGKRSEVDPERVVKLSEMCMDSRPLSEIEEGRSKRAK